VSRLRSRRYHRRETGHRTGTDVHRRTRERARGRIALGEAAEDIAETLADQFLVGIQPLAVLVAMALAIEIASMKPSSEM